MTTTGRRALLAAGAAAGATALVGCTSSGGEGPRRSGAAEREAERVARAEAALRARSVAVARGLLERYDAVLAAHPALAPRLTPLRRSVAAHVGALGEGGTGGEGVGEGVTGALKPAAASASASARPTAAPSPAPVPVAADPGTALRELAAAERAASDGHTDALLAAPPEYARLLASVAASGAVHVHLLTEGARA
ncbi:hypothetical protein ACFUIZ_16410 [Streptomyces cinereoruber]|uniref:hypothetical protein n=1 Tax=Streptomyces cinereoruber TaxID=67260 RepID=UPI00362A21FE